MLDQTLYTLREISSWKELTAYEEHLPKPTGGENKEWIYRGQKTHDKFDFASSLDRARQAFDIRFDEMPDLETRLVREFKRRLHHYTSNIPDATDHLEWLALMQHYGAPTRLLDWTYSFYIAAYFAVEKADDKGCEVWALNTSHFSAQTALSDEEFTSVQAKVEHRKQDSSPEYADAAHMLQDVMVERLLKQPMACVHPANPFRLNERLTVQQGVFLFPGSISMSIEENICIREYRPQSADNLVRFRIKAGAAVRKDILEKLYRMNVSRAALFPGLSGFAESLRTRVGFMPKI
jgi:hypothetical protein